MTDDGRPPIQRRLFWDNIPPRKPEPPPSSEPEENLWAADDAASEPQVYSVTALTNYISHLLERDSILRDVWVSGEVSNARRNESSGHWYFDLKDAKARLSCVMWRSSAIKQATLPRDGHSFRLRGKIDIYAPKGGYQLVVEEIESLSAVGSLQAEFERLKAQLAAEGLFDQTRKRSLPPRPVRIGIVTSPEAAALQDVLNVLSRRYPLAQLILSPTSVQGEAAPPQIVRALRRLNELEGSEACEVILVVRGGGSLEDLWCFNDERVVRAIAASAIPVVSGVGHEIDFTLADFAADLRAPTPSAAAEMATPDIGELYGELAYESERLSRALRQTLVSYTAELRQATRALERQAPRRRLATDRQQVDELSERLGFITRRYLALHHERLQARAERLQAASPLNILARGYAIVTDADGRRVFGRAAELHPGMRLRLRLADGQRRAVVDDEPMDLDDGRP
ncbi:MAG: exodeoxyribonuclease VII large subunit [Anaerolineae bacterium]|nr:exodeoxyribonuclease VII large subunit [Anaerolineae bacterium]MDW8172268.1 exodeoxyribonuclease VII large subunit [Anaerolineae bacterium]